MMSYSCKKVEFLLGLFVGLLVAMNLLGGKIIVFFGVSTSVSIFLIPLTFLITDVISETHGSVLARRFVNIGCAVLVLVLVSVFAFRALPPSERYPHDLEYNIVFGSSARMFVASIVAFFISQLYDVWVFEKIKEFTDGRFLWLRNNISTIFSQGLDTLLFMFIAFYASAPQYNLFFVLELSFPYWLLRVLFAALDTPLVYLGARWLRI